MSKQRTKEQRQQEKGRRQRLFKIFDRGVGVPVVIFLTLWLVGGTILTLMATFAGSALTLGLLGWPVGIVGFAITFGVAWLVYTLFTEGGDRLQAWAADAERDPEEEARHKAEDDEYWNAVVNCAKTKRVSRR
jgi:hypothetical protein